MLDSSVKAQNKYERNRRYYANNRAYDDLSGVRWTDLEKFVAQNAPFRDIEIAKLLNRSLQSVQVMRSKMFANGDDAGVYLNDVEFNRYAEDIRL